MARMSRAHEQDVAPLQLEDPKARSAPFEVLGMDVLARRQPVDSTQAGDVEQHAPVRMSGRSWSISMAPDSAPSLVMEL